MNIELNLMPHELELAVWLRENVAQYATGFWLKRSVLDPGEFRKNETSRVCAKILAQALEQIADVGEKTRLVR